MPTNGPIEGQTNGHYISGVQTEYNSHKIKAKLPKRPDLDAMEAGDPINNAISDNKFKKN